MAIIRSTLTYGYEACTTTKHTERNLRTFKNSLEENMWTYVKPWGTGGGDKIVTNIIYIININRYLSNKEYDLLELVPVTSFIKGQQIQWLGHIMKRGEKEVVRVALEWKPQGKIPRERPRKR